MKNSKLRRALLLLASAVLLVSLSVGATLAYLTSTTEVVQNTFTVGKVNITLDEADVDEYGNLVYKTDDEGNTTTELADRVLKNEYKLLPGHTYIKDPIVHMAADSEFSYVRMMVTVKDLKDLKTVFSTAVDPSTKVFLLQNFVNWDSAKWIYAGCTEAEGGDSAEYEFRYYQTKGTVDGAAADLEPLFTTITIPGTVANADLAKLEEVEINVIAHAIQADGFADADAAWTAFAQ